MKKNVFILLIIIITQISYSQVDDQSFNPEAEANRLAQTPNSPEAQAFTKYGNTPVNMYTGAPNIQVPIYIHKGRELDLPISLTYDASGIKVDQLATQVGLGWNLNVGGRISRLTQGFPDDFISGEYTNIPYKSIFDSEVRMQINKYKDSVNAPSFDSKGELLAYMDFLRKTNENQYDTQPDYFSFNALGNSDTFVIDISKERALQPKALDNPNTKVAFVKRVLPEAISPIESWIVTTDDGTKYTFNEAEVSRDRNLGKEDDNLSFYGYIKEYNSSWLLTKIESARRKDVYEFTYYTGFDFWSSDRSGGQITGVTNALKCQNNYGSSSPSPTNIMGYNGNGNYKIKQKFLKSIIHNGKQIVKIDLLDKRWDLGVNSAIKKIHIYNKDTDNHSEDLHKSFEFVYDYFRTKSAKEAPYTTNHVPGEIFVRLKLDEILIKGSAENFLKKYQFNYIEPYDLASTTAFSKDYYGYNNGFSNSVLFSKFSHPCVPSNGGNRSTNFNFAKRGMLDKITYPTGGYTEFTYERNYERKIAREGDAFIRVADVNLSNNEDNLSDDSNACNSIFNGSSFTPNTNYAIFEVTQPKIHKIKWRRLFEGEDNGHPRGTYSANHTFTLIKIKNQDLPVIWTDIFDENCNKKQNSNFEVVWTQDFPQTEYESLPFAGTDELELVPGHYQLMIANPFRNVNFQLTAEGSNRFTEYEYIEKAGIRVNSIKDFDDNASLAMQKTYEYPSGTVISNPNYNYLSAQYAAVDGMIEETEILHRLSFASGTDKPHIGYSEVIEKTVNEDLQLGRTSHYFYTDRAGNYKTGIYSYYTTPHGSGNYPKETAKHYGVDYQLGKPMATFVDNNNNERVSASHTYYQNKTFNTSLKSLAIRINESKSHLYPIPTENTSGKWFIRYVEPRRDVYEGSVGGMINISVPNECNIENFETRINKANLCQPVIARLSKQSVYSWGKVGNTSLSTNTQYFDNNTKKLSQRTSYFYNDEDKIVPGPKGDSTIPGNYLLKATETTSSEGDVLKQELIYPSSGALVNANIIANPIEIKTYKNEVLLAHKKTIYSGIFPSKIQIAKGTGLLEDRLIIEQYIDGNPVQIRQSEGSPTAYLWGYNKTQPIAKIENVTYQELEAAIGNISDTIFNTVAKIQNISNSDMNRVIGEANTGEGLLRKALNQLRDVPSLSNAQVTTYTYDPLIGVTSITDPRGETIYYHYDSFNRLESVKDAQGYLLSENKYNYKN
jgi:YD repeat-containing protein